jgi:hypothetical protein
LSPLGFASSVLIENVIVLLAYAIIYARLLRTKHSNTSN